MWNSKFKTKIIYFISLFNSHSAIRIPQSIFSPGQQKILFALAFLILLLLYLKFYYHPALPPEEVYEEIVIEVAGEVRKPGVYLFKNPPTLKKAIEKAGGLKENALFDESLSPGILETGTLLTVQKESLQISLPLPSAKGGAERTEHDEIKIKIGRMEAKKLLVFSIPLDLNQVSVEDLCLIPGIGESLAQEMIAYRERRKGFRSVEELKNVKGIGEKKFKEFKAYFIVNL